MCKMPDTTHRWNADKWGTQLLYNEARHSCCATRDRKPVTWNKMRGAASEEEESWNVGTTGTLSILAANGTHAGTLAC
jgi:hypothetical protein